MRKRYLISSAIPHCCGLLLAGVLLGGCTAVDQTLHQLRVQRFPQSPEETVKTSAQARALYLQATPNGSGLTKESIAAANVLLTAQGPIHRQILTIVPLSPVGERLAPRLAKALEAAGARSPQHGAYEVDGGKEAEPARALAEQQQGWDIELISEAIVVNVPNCSVERPDIWTVAPYEGVGTLGCANQANIAMMVSDPRDLLRPRSLGPTEGRIAASAVDRYLNGELNELIDIDFSGDD